MLGLKRDTVEHKEYNPTWKEEFLKEEKLLSEILRGNVLSISHVGSTAIPWICAKPILDIAAEVESFAILDSLNEDLHKNGYIHRPMGDAPGRLFYIKGGEDYRTHHIHFFEKGSEELKEHLFFRDYLIQNKDTAIEYEGLKKKLAAQFATDRESYTNGKAGFIKGVLGRMRTNIYFVRHAQPDYSTGDEKMCPLTEKGKKDVKMVTKVLQGKNIQAVYSSPYKRAFDTVKDFADVNGFEVNIVEGFRERRVADKWVEDFKTFSRNQWSDFNFKLEKGECLREVQERNIAALYKVLRENVGKNIAVGSHGTALSVIINHFNPDFGYDNFWAIVDRMPYIMCLKFGYIDFEGIEEVNNDFY